MAGTQTCSCLPAKLNFRPAQPMGVKASDAQLLQWEALKCLCLGSGSWLIQAEVNEKKSFGQNSDRFFWGRVKQFVVCCKGLLYERDCFLTGHFILHQTIFMTTHVVRVGFAPKIWLEKGSALLTYQKSLQRKYKCCWRNHQSGRLCWVIQSQKLFDRRKS